MNQDAAAIYPRQAPDAIIRVHEATEDRLVLDIPPGKGSAGIGCFALIWNVFMAFFTAMICVALTQNKAPDFGLFPALFISVFWLVGFGMIYAWVKLRFERCFLFVDRGRAVLRKMLFHWQNQTELELDESSRAALTESYKENDVPVYRVTITGLGGNALHFGTSLTGREKDWCVDAINALLKPLPITTPQPFVPTSPLVCEACGQPFPKDAIRTDDGRIICPACEHQQIVTGTTAAESVEKSDDTPLPDELPGIVTIREESPERLIVSLSWTEYPVAWRVAVAMTLLMAGLTTAFMGGNLAALLWFDPKPANNDVVAQWMPVVFAVPVMLGILSAWSVFTFAALGRLTTRIDAERVIVRFHVGPFGKSWNMATPAITAVRVTTRDDFPSQALNPRVSNPRVAADSNVRVQPSAGFHTAAAVFAGPRILIMTLFHQQLTARFVVETARRWLRNNAPDVKV